MISVVLCAFALGAPLGQAPQASRIRAIWDAAEDRIVRQNDLWFKQGDFPRAVQSLQFLYGLEPDDYEIATDLGWMLENVERWDEALAIYRKYRLAHPQNPDAAIPEAQYMFMKRKYDQIPAVLEPAIKMPTHPHPNAYRLLANAYDRLKRYADAKRVWEVYLKVNPSDETAKANLRKVEKKLAGG